MDLYDDKTTGSSDASADLKVRCPFFFLPIFENLNPRPGKNSNLSAKRDREADGDHMDPQEVGQAAAGADGTAVSCSHLKKKKPNMFNEFSSFSSQAVAVDATPVPAAVEGATPSIVAVDAEEIVEEHSDPRTMD